jgi:hypothetical protein
MPNTILSFDLEPSDPTIPLGFELWLDDQQLLDLDCVDKTLNFSHEFEDTAGEHILRFIMKNKKTEHTKISESGEILKDALLKIHNVSFDEINLGQIFIDQAVYTHDFNGTQAETQDKFYNSMGCNGTVSLKFTTPIYLWLLEHM